MRAASHQEEADAEIYFSIAAGVSNVYGVKEKLSCRLSLFT